MLRHFLKNKGEWDEIIFAGANHKRYNKLLNRNKKQRERLKEHSVDQEAVSEHSKWLLQPVIH